MITSLFSEVGPKRLVMSLMTDVRPFVTDDWCSMPHLLSLVVATI